jgi:DnaK suppressor protein
MKIKVSLTTKEKILEQLKHLENSEVPPSKMGAMCYSMSAPPEVAEYVCPVCGEKTYYSRDHAMFIDWEIDECRREFQNLQKLTDICSLDESSFCASCYPDATEYSLKLTVSYPDGSSVVSSILDSDELRILCDFFQGKLSYTTSTDDSRPLKSELRTLRNLLLYGTGSDKDKSIEFSRKKRGGRMPAKIAKEFNPKDYKIRVVLEGMREKILQNIHLHTDASNATASTKESGADIYDQASVDRDRELNLLLNDREREKLHEIDEALHRIETGEYGLCEECEEEIPLGRLMVLPLTRHCVKCKTEIEKLQSKLPNE